MLMFSTWNRCALENMDTTAVCSTVEELVLALEAVNEHPSKRDGDECSSPLAWVVVPAVEISSGEFAAVDETDSSL